MSTAAICVASLLAASAPVSAGVVGLLNSSGVQGGIVVHLGCGDGRETAKLLVNDRFLVQGLDADEANVREARRYLQAMKLYGKVSARRFDGEHLPYVDNLVDLVIDSTGGSVPEAEILRVLAPSGVAYLGEKRIVKPRPADIDDWTHFLHGPDNNAVARDRRVDLPRSIQWVAGRRWSRSHEEMASMSAAVCAKGRIFYIMDEAPLASIRFTGEWKLVARDAFNGVLLWKKSIPSWVDSLRHFRSGPAHLPRRLVAAGDRVYVTLGLAAPVVALDAATGETLMRCEGTERAEEIVLDRGVLYVVTGTSEAIRRGGGLSARGEPAPTKFRRIAAVDADSGKLLWSKDCTRENILPLTLAVKGSRLYYQSLFGVVCVDARTGKDIWKTPRQTPARRMAYSAPTLVATDEVILCADRDAGKGEENRPSTGTVVWGVNGWNEPGFARRAKCTLRAYSASDGRELWSAPCSEGYNSPVDLFVIGDTVWIGSSFEGRDLKTGALTGRLDTKAPPVGMAHHRCYRDKASERFIFTGKSGIEALSLEKGGWVSNNSWIRGTCAYGIIPANGLLYAPPDACACFLTVKTQGFFAAAPPRNGRVAMPLPERPVLEKGPGYGESLGSAAAAADDWPMYRHDGARSSAASTRLPDAVQRRWSVKLGGRLAQPAIADGKVFVAAVDAHTLHVLNAEDGRELWRFTAGGRIDSSPTVYRGRAFFGSADGWVYCLDADDGSLVWRFRAAPQERLVSAFGQLESAWPVHGAVLVQNGSLYVAAGRSSYLDGGIVLYRLDPATGEQRSRTVLCHLDPKTGRQLVPEARFNMEGTTADILSGDGDLVFLKYFTFDREGKRTQTTRPHLYSITGLLGEEWFVRSYWVVGQGMPGAGWGHWTDAAHAFPFGRILCFNENLVCGYGRETVSPGPVGHRADTYRLFCADRTQAAASAAEDSPAGRNKRRGRAAPGKPSKPAPRWSHPSSLIVRAMAMAADRLAVAGPVDVGKKDPNRLAFLNEAEAEAGFAGKEGVRLQLISVTDGRTISETKLDALPAFDGMAAAGGRIYLSLRNGAIVCLGQ